MKKTIKIILPAAAGLISIAVWILTLVMVNTVNSEKIFFINSGTGSFYASSYRIFAVVSAVILIVWIIAAVRYVPRIIKFIMLKLRSIKPQKEKEQGAEEASVPDTAKPPVEGDVALLHDQASVNDIGGIPELIPVTEKAAAPIPQVQPAAAPIPQVQPAAAPIPQVQPAAAPIPQVQPAAAPIPQVQPDAQEKMVTCGQCGKSIRAKAKFCPFCGTKNQNS